MVIYCFSLYNESDWRLEAVKLQICQNTLKLVHTSPKYFEDHMTSLCEGHVEI